MSRPVLQRGFLIIAAMALIVIVGFLVLALAYIFTGDVTSSGTHAQSAKALFIAETGIERNTSRLLSPNLAPPVSALTRLPCNAALNETDIAYGQGMYTVAVRNPNFTAAGAAPIYSGAATLNGAIGAGDTTITVNNPPGTGTYASSGRIMIDRELIDYRDTTPTSFLNAVRGMDGSIPAPHVTGTRVGHYQCNLLSQGGVPNLNLAANPPPDGFRWLNVGVQLQEGWAVGNGGNIFRWNGTAWAAVAPVPVATPLNGVSLLSYADGWAVGNQSGGEVILRWTGGPNWARIVPVAAIPNTNLNSVHCVATNDCWAVGDPWNPPGAATPIQGLILRWTGGATWAPFFPPGATQVPNVSLRSVHCVATNDCWIVGNQGGGEVILRWTGGPNWARMAVQGPIPNQNLNSVYCVATNDCWAVGNNHGGGGGAVAGETILRWQGGPNWARWPVSAIPDVPLLSVNCVKSDDCWAVGNALGGAGGEVILHWDGAAWTRLPISALPNQTLRSVYLIGARQRPQAGWQEDYR